MQLRPKRQGTTHKELIEAIAFQNKDSAVYPNSKKETPRKPVWLGAEEKIATDEGRYKMGFHHVASWTLWLTGTMNAILSTVDEPKGIQ